MLSAERRQWGDSGRSRRKGAKIFAPNSAPANALKFQYLGQRTKFLVFSHARGFTAANRCSLDSRNIKSDCLNSVKSRAIPVSPRLCIRDPNFVDDMVCDARRLPSFKTGKGGGLLADEKLVLSVVLYVQSDVFQ
jgi:hypothetical protein